MNQEWFQIKQLYFARHHPGHRTVCLSDIDQNRNIVANAAAQYKQVPDAMHPWKTVIKRIKHHPTGIENAAG